MFICREAASQCGTTIHLMLKKSELFWSETEVCTIISILSFFNGFTIFIDCNKKNLNCFVVFMFTTYGICFFVLWYNFPNLFNKQRFAKWDHFINKSYLYILRNTAINSSVFLSVKCFKLFSSDPFVPSTILKAIKHMLESEKELSSKFVHSILEHLNWSFSEFLTQLQEVCDLPIINNLSIILTIFLYIYIYILNL